MKRVLVCISIILLFTLAGCSLSVETPVQEKGVSTSDSNITYVGEGVGYNLTESFGVNEKIVISALFPGWSDTIPVIVVCGKDRDRSIAISIDSATDPTEGFEALPEEYFSWFSIPNSRVDLTSGESRKVPVTVTIPKDVKCKEKNYEVWILVRDTSQTGLVQIAYYVKWYLSFR